MRSNKKPPWGPGPPASQAPPSSAEGGKSSRRQPCCCCQWHLSAAIRYMWCTWTLRNSDYPWEPRNSPWAMPLTGFCGFLVLIGMKFRCARMIFRSYAQTKCFSGKGKVSVLWEGYRSPPTITNFIISACGGILEPMSISPMLYKFL